MQKSKEIRGGVRSRSKAARVHDGGPAGHLHHNLVQGQFVIERLSCAEAPSFPIMPLSIVEPSSSSTTDESIPTCGKYT
jgi:hypothetical protein